MNRSSLHNFLIISLTGCALIVCSGCATSAGGVGDAPGGPIPTCMCEDNHHGRCDIVSDACGDGYIAICNSAEAPECSPCTCKEL